MEKHGRIQRALERARQIREEALPREASTSNLAIDKTTVTGEHRALMQALPAFSEVPVDLAKCAENRILHPDLPAPTKERPTTGSAAYRVLRTRLLHRTRANLWSTIGVTSPGQGDGKSVTALNLALSIAKEGNNSVFLIDLDMRNPKMCTYLGATPPTSIVDYLSGDGEPEDALFSISVPFLTLAGTTSSTDMASELLAGQRVDLLFDYVQKIAYRPLILIDLPPLLSTDDALIIADKVDACLLVLAEGGSKRDHAVEALELMAEFNLAGLILNKSNAVVSDYYST